MNISVFVLIEKAIEFQTVKGILHALAEGDYTAWAVNLTEKFFIAFLRINKPYSKQPSTFAARVGSSQRPGNLAGSHSEVYRRRRTLDMH